MLLTRAQRAAAYLKPVRAERAEIPEVVREEEGVLLILAHLEFVLSKTQLPGVPLAPLGQGAEEGEGQDRAVAAEGEVAVLRVTPETPEIPLFLMVALVTPATPEVPVTQDWQVAPLRLIACQ